MNKCLNSRKGVKGGGKGSEVRGVAHSAEIIGERTIN